MPSPVAAQRAADLVLRDVHEADLEFLVGLGVADEVAHAPPGRLDLLEFLLVQHEIDLRRELAVDLGNDGLDAGVGIVGHGRGMDQGLLGQGAHRGLDGAAGCVGLGAELPVEQEREVRDFAVAARCGLGEDDGVAG